MSAPHPGLQRMIEPTEDKFLLFLKSIGAVPFTPESVEAYKAMQVRRHTPWFWERLQFRQNAGQVIFIAGAVSIFANLIAAYITLFVPGTAIFTAGLASVVPLCLLLLFLLDKVSTKADPEWRMRVYHHYRDPIPAEVAAVASAIERNYMYANLFVEALGSDPFLVVQRGRDIYYVAVWDETDFAPKHAD